jgi:hypothetical protein
MGDVEYGFLETAEDIPGGLGRGGGSKLNDLVDKLLDDPSMHKQAVMIASYAKKTAAGGAANVLRQRYGRDASVRGLTFATRRVQTADGTDRSGLWVYCDPSLVVEGQWDKHQKAEKVRKAKLAATLKEQKEAKKAAASA